MSKKPTVLMILDGYGLNKNCDHNAVCEAKTPIMDQLMSQCPYVEGQASGMAVGLPEGQMGNSEVGHLNMGAGRIVYQELTRITKAIEDGDFFENPELLAAVENAKKNNIPVHVGPIFSSDIFYDPQKDFYKLPQELGILAVEMESYALFLNAMRLHKKALCLLTVSDSFVNDEKDLTQEERSHNLTRMVELALTLA